MKIWFSRIMSFIALYVMAGGVLIDLRTAMDPDTSFHSSLVDGVTSVGAVANAALLPFVAFLVYFAIWGRLGWQIRVAVVAVCLTGSGSLTYVIASLSARYSLPGNYMDAALVVSAFFTIFMWFGVALGVWLRWKRIRPSTWPSHPKCEGCGYDLYGNTSRRCPECGKAIGAVHGLCS